MNRRDYQKSDYIEQKTLEYYFDWDKNKAYNVFKIRHSLNSTWFELYMKLFMEHLWYKMNKEIWWLKADGGIDLRGLNWEQKIYIQCKKYIKNNLYKGKINVWDIRNFFWGVVSADKKYKDSLLIFVNSAEYTDSAKEFAKLNNIELWDYKDIWEMYYTYSFKDFLAELEIKWYKKENYTKYYQTSIQNISIKDLNDNDIFKYLSNIRNKIATEEKGIWDRNTWLIFSNELLQDFSKKRPYNMPLLKRINTKHSYEKKYIQKYWKNIIKWFNILYQR